MKTPGRVTGTPESRRPSNSLGTFISMPTGNCASYGTRTLGLRKSSCSRSEALSVHSCSIATQTPKHSVVDGKTPELTIHQARDLLASLDTSHVLGLRDRAVLGTLIYTGARVGAIAQLRLQDLRDQGEHRVLRFSEKGGKEREIPVRHGLDEWDQRLPRRGAT